MFQRGIELPARSAIYTRVSTEEQRDAGLSLETQLHSCIQALVARGLSPPFCHYCDAGISAGTVARRPAMSRLMEDVRAKRITHVIATKLDRLWRSTKDALNSLDEIKAAGCAIIVLDVSLDMTSPLGEIVFTMMGAFAQFERKQVGARTHAVNTRIVLGGRHVGGHSPPCGYLRDENKQLVPDPETAPIVQRIFAEYVRDEETGPGKIARDLTRDGLRTRAGTFWQRAAVLQILRNPVYGGDLAYGHSSVPRHRRWKDDTERLRAKGAHEPLIDPETGRRAREKMERRHRPGRTPSPRYLLSGLVHCAHCHGPYYTSPTSDGRGSLYLCGTVKRALRANCPDSRAIVVRVLDELVVPALVANIGRIRTGGGTKPRPRPRADGAERRREWERDRIAGKMARLQHVYLEGDLTENQWRSRRAALQAELDGLAAAPIDAPPPPAPTVLAEAVAALSDPDARMERRRALVAVFIERIVVGREEVVVHYRDLAWVGWRTEETLRRPKPWERPRPKRA